MTATSPIWRAMVAAEYGELSPARPPVDSPGQGLALVLLRWSSRVLLSLLDGARLVGFVLALIPKPDLASPFSFFLGPGVNCWGLSFVSYSSVGQFSGLSSGSRGGGFPGGAKRWKGLGVGHTCWCVPLVPCSTTFCKFTVVRVAGAGFGLCSESFAG